MAFPQRCATGWACFRAVEPHRSPARLKPGRGRRTWAMLRRMAIGMMLLVSASAASADPWNGCYAHRYDATHLTKNPRQIMESLAVELFRAPTVDDEVWTVSIDVTLVRNAKRWGNGGTCSAAKDMLRCGLDGDSGQITFKRTADGLQLAIKSLNLD